MSAIQDAIEALKATVIQGESDKHVRDALDRVTSFLILLNSSSPSLQAIRKLRSVLRQPLQPLYAASLEATLQLSSAVLSQILGERLPDARRVGDTASCAEWDATANVILAGVLDFVDHNSDGDSNCNMAVASFFYPVITGFFFPDISKISLELSVPLCISAYNILSDTAVGQTANQDLLRDRAVLGGQRLGAAISSARDYLLMEALLTLFARLIPPTNNTTRGTLKRAKFVKEVLGSPKLFKCNAELLDIMHKISSTNWDDTAARIVDALGRTDITYPQTFALEEIDACGCIFPQPTDADRLVMDKQGFLANVILANSDICESLQILYAHVRTVTIDTSEVPDGKVLVTVDLTAPPLVADVAMDVPAGKPSRLTVLLDREDLSRFMEALRRRGVGKLNFINSMRKAVKARRAISLATEVKFAESSSPLPPATSFEDKVKRVEEVYETDMEDPATSGFLMVEDARDVFLSACGDREEPAGCAGSSISTGRDKGPSASTISAMKLSASPRKRGYDVLPHGASVFGKAQKDLSDDLDVENKPSESLPVRHRDEEATSKPAKSLPQASANKHRTQRKRINDSGDEISTELTATDRHAVAVAVPRQEKSEVEEVDPPPDSFPPNILARALFNRPDFAPPNDYLQAPGNPPKDEEDKRCVSDEGTVVMPNNFTVSKPLSGMDIQPTSDVRAALASGDTGQIEDREAAHPVGQQSTSSARARRGRKAKIPNKELTLIHNLAGSRRKREAAKPSDGPADADSEDKNVHPNKRTRKADSQDASTADKQTNSKPSPEAVTRTPTRPIKRYGKKTKGSCPITTSQTVNFDEVPGGSTRFSSNLAMTKAKRKGAQAPRETRAKTTRSGGGKKLPVKAPTDVELAEPGAAQPISRPTEEVTENVPTQKRHDAAQAISSMRCSPPVLHSFARDIDPINATDAEDVVMDSRENEEMPELRESDRAGVSFESSTREETLSAAQYISAEASETVDLGPVEGLLLDNDRVSTNFDATGTKAKDEGVEYSVSLNDSKALVEAFDPHLWELTPQKKMITIDLTLDDSPIRGREYAHTVVSKEKAAQPAAEAIAVELKTEVTDTDVVGDMAEGFSTHVTQSPPRRKHLSVTFASPVGNVERESANSQSEATRRSFETRCVQTDAGTEYGHSVDYETPGHPNNTMDVVPNVLGTLPRIKYTPPNQGVGLRFTPLKNLSEMNMSVHRPCSLFEPKASRGPGHNATGDDVDVKEIVDVLNVIQDVITKGISNKLSNVKRDMREARDQLVREVLDDLQGMATVNVRQFNDMVNLEEQYYKYRKDVASLWESLLQCNESISLSLENALKEHDQNISARTFPPSLLPNGSHFPSGRQRT